MSKELTLLLLALLVSLAVSALALIKRHRNATNPSLEMQERYDTGISYEDFLLTEAEKAIKTGHRDQANLRDLLILTTNTVTVDLVMAYFRSHHRDQQLLSDLVDIALEGEEMGDAPWAAANVLSEFPVTLLSEHRPALESLAREQWSYLNRPAKSALARIDTSD